MFIFHPISQYHSQNPPNTPPRERAFGAFLESSLIAPAPLSQSLFELKAWCISYVHLIASLLS